MIQKLNNTGYLQDFFPAVITEKINELVDATNNHLDWHLRNRHYVPLSESGPSKMFTQPKSKFSWGIDGLDKTESTSPINSARFALVANSIADKINGDVKDLINHYVGDAKKQARIEALKETRALIPKPRTCADASTFYASIDKLIEECK